MSLLYPSPAVHTCFSRFRSKTCTVEPSSTRSCCRSGVCGHVRWRRQQRVLFLSRLLYERSSCRCTSIPTHCHIVVVLRTRISVALMCHDRRQRILYNIITSSVLTAHTSKSTGFVGVLNICRSKTPLVAVEQVDVCVPIHPIRRVTGASGWIARRRWLEQLVRSVGHARVKALGSCLFHATNWKMQCVLAWRRQRTLNLTKRWTVFSFRPTLVDCWSKWGMAVEASGVLSTLVWQDTLCAFVFQQWFDGSTGRPSARFGRLTSRRPCSLSTRYTFAVYRVRAVNTSYRNCTTLLHQHVIIGRPTARTNPEEPPAPGPASRRRRALSFFVRVRSVGRVQ